MDDAFEFNADGLKHAIDLMASPKNVAFAWPARLPDEGLGARATLDLLAGPVLGGAQHLKGPTSFAHMDPPTPWVTWATTLWTASLNQNLLHPATSPVARDIEARVVQWLAPAFGMTGGHMTPGSTVANLTALWAAREVAHVETVVASDMAHLSVGKAAHILGLRFVAVPTDAAGRLDRNALPHDLSRAALVLTAGTTATGAVDPLDLALRNAAWTHVDAAWAGPLRLSGREACRLAGIERADSVAVSAHKWLYQPKESALIFFRNVDVAHKAISFGGAYLAVPNVGLLGSHGAVAVPLLATLLAFGRLGLARRIEKNMDDALRLAAFLDRHPRIDLFGVPETGVVVWRPKALASMDAVYGRLPQGATSRTAINGAQWFRQVAANPTADMDALERAIADAVEI